MIIKNYVYDTTSPSGGVLHIIENVSKVKVYLSSYQGLNANGPRFEGTDMPVSWIEHASPSSPDDVFYFIDFTDSDGVRHRLKVTSYAYICNDQGKTIDRVGVKTAYKPDDQSMIVS